MSNYTPFVPPSTLGEYAMADWEAQLTTNVNLENIQWDETSIQDERRVMHNAHEMTTRLIKSYVDHIVTNLNDHYNRALDTAYSHIAILNAKLVAAEVQVKSFEKELNRLPANINSSVGKTKIPEPPTFAGSENKMHLQDWLNQMALYCSATGITTDQQKIVCAMTRLRAPAATYMKAYFNNVQEDIDLGTWDTFVQELKNIYGQRDDKEGAKKELTQLWANKDLAKKNFIKYVERYRTLARIINYTDEVHIDKLKEVVPEELRNALVFYELNNKVPTDWDGYIKLLMNAYKALHPEKTQGVIFGNSGNAGGSGNKDSDAMEIDQAKKKKDKEVNIQEKVQKYCQICAGKGFKSKSKTHNTIDCYDRPGNEGKRPQRSATSPLPPSYNRPSSPTTGSSTSTNKGKSFKSRLLEMLNTINDDEDSSETPSDVIDINSATIKEIPDPMPADKKATNDNDTSKGSRRLTSPKVKGRAEVDFPLGL